MELWISEIRVAAETNIYRIRSQFGRGLCVCGLVVGLGGRGVTIGWQFEASSLNLRNNGMIQLRGNTRDY